jgi:thiol-disulfide isomerase/thioredoxin
MYKVIKGVVPIDGDEPVEIKHKEGEVIYAVFWLSWSPPCQKPMELSQLIMNKKKGEWGDKLRIIGLSFD